MALLDYQFEVGGVVFGYDSPIILDGEDGFDPGIASVDTQDADYDQEDGTRFGRDFLRGPTWSFKLGTNQTDPQTALAELARLATVWRNEDVRLVTGGFATLRYTVAGRTRRVYGRPRRFAHPPENRILGGWIPITADFQTADALHYDDHEDSTSVVVTASTNGGFTTPIITPLTTLEKSGSREGRVHVGGDATTWARVTFAGPVVNPQLIVENQWEISLRTNIPAGQSVTVDAHPWMRTAMRSDGASVAGTLSRGSRMLDMRLRPGSHSFIYRGEDVTGTSRCTVAWRNANHSL